MNTCLVVPPVVVNGPGDVLLENSERLLCDFFLSEIIRYNLFDELADAFVPFPEVFHEFIDNHLPKLFPLLDGLSFLDRRMQFATFPRTLRFCVLLDSTHLSYINVYLILQNNLYHQQKEGSLFTHTNHFFNVLATISAFYSGPSLSNEDLRDAIASYFFWKNISRGLKMWTNPP